MSLYRRDFHETKYIHVLLITDDELLEKYNEIWEKVSNMGKLSKNVHNNKIPTKASQYICSSVILIDSIFRTG